MLLATSHACHQMKCYRTMSTQGLVGSWVIKVNQKSPNLMNDLVHSFSNPGQVDLDLFAGALSIAMDSPALQKHPRFVV